MKGMSEEDKGLVLLKILGDEKRRYLELMKDHPKELKIGLAVFDTLAGRFLEVREKDRREGISHRE